MSDKELIKQEIEKLKHSTPNAYDRGRFMLLSEIEDFIDSLPEEPVRKEGYYYTKINQKPADEANPKFKVGDWIVKQYVSSPFIIVDIKNDSYILNDIEGNKYKETIDDFAHRVYHLWTIEDAEEGDILTYRLDNGNVLIMIYECLGESYEGEVDIHAILDGDYFSESAAAACCKYMELLTPATKEQRDRLFSKMREAGYEWNEEEKELRGIKQEPADKTEPKIHIEKDK